MSVPFDFLNAPLSAECERQLLALGFIEAVAAHKKWQQAKHIVEEGV